LRPFSLSKTYVSSASQLVAQGSSWTINSNHLSGNAFDIVIWDPVTNDVTWSGYEKVGEIGKKLGLGWGGDWTVRDDVHFEHVS
jgi:hypothetical protein